ncbi:hypothetical protein [Sphingopyxis terrae]|uniref:hypothetical protein n=1 Tax=Sphingopyxis terrae TaxID=33052 RepID=UPI0007882622|nr:hypothetical protein [Sphingopyxis terrae]
MTFLARLFGRKPKPTQPIDRRGWSEDWQVGDLAQCISDKWYRQWAENPKRGDVLRVCGLVEGISTTGEDIISALQFESKPANRSWAENMFQKIRPAEQCFTEAMRNLLRQPVTPTGLSSADSDGGMTSPTPSIHSANLVGALHNRALASFSVFPHRSSLGATDPPSQAHKK